MIQAVNQIGDPFAGGSRTPAGTPVGVGGTINFPGTQAAPPGVPASAIISARNNRGSNVRLPYARLVPMHGRMDLNDMKRQVLVDGKPALEYDGLRAAELAWVLGRRFKAVSGQDFQDVNERELYSYQANAGLGHGVDRMQRLASTAWVEGLFEQKLAGVRIELTTIALDSAHVLAMDSHCNQYKKYLKGCFATNCIDLARALAYGSVAAAANPATLMNIIPVMQEENKMQGIFCRETGPFLRGIQMDTRLVTFPEERRPHHTALLDASVSRHVGCELCFSALEVEMRRRNLMDWTPDGLILSKLEDSDSHASAETNARMAQLFNVAIAGPAISTSWTTDLRDAKMECQPMDRVFVVVEADLVCKFEQTGGSVYDEAEKLSDKRNEIVDATAAYNNSVYKNEAAATVANFAKAVADRTAELEAIVTAYKAAADAVVGQEPGYITAHKALLDKKKKHDEVMGDPRKTVAEKQTAIKEFSDAKQAVDTKLEKTDWNDTSLETLRTLQAQLRAGKKTPSLATLTNFRLRRVTSSYLNNYSNWQPNNKDSRCGLRLGTDSEIETVAEYIVGGWCIGTVMDSAASRSTVGQTVRTAPCSMALNVNVNIEWWSADKLFHNYMDMHGSVTSRGRNELPSATKKRKMDHLYKDAAEDPDYTGTVDGNGVPTKLGVVDPTLIGAAASGDTSAAAKSVRGASASKPRPGGGLEIAAEAASSQDLSSGGKAAQTRRAPQK